MDEIEAVPTKVYITSSVIGIPPSTLGGFWGWAWANSSGTIYKQSCGMNTAEQFGAVFVSTKFMEAVAVIRALIALPNGFDGTIIVPSQTVIDAVFGGQVNDVALTDVMRARAARGTR